MTSSSSRWIATLAAAALMQTAGAAEPDVAATLARFNVQEHPTAARESPRWRAPSKVMLLQFGFHPGESVSFSEAAPDTTIVVARNIGSAIAQAADVDVIIGSNPAVCNARLIEVARELRWLVSLSAGIELCANLPTLQTRQVTMTNMRGIDSPVIAEHTIALMLALAHGLDMFAGANAQGGLRRQDSVPMQFLGGKTMLVSGLGGIGTEVARRASGLGMKVVATRVGGEGKPDFVHHVGQPDELLSLARTADVIVSAVPLTPETTGMYDEEFFAVLKPTAFFINVARGRSVVTSALMEALNENRLAGAGLDVVDPEPLPAGHPLWQSPRVLITPHIAARADQTDDARWTVALENLRRYVRGEPLLNVVDLERGY